MIERLLGLFPHTDIADDAHEETEVFHFTHSHLHRESRAILAATHHLVPGLARTISSGQITPEVAVVRHQDRDLLAEQLTLCVAEDASGSGIDGHDCAVPIDGDDRVGGGSQNRP